MLTVSVTGSILITSKSPNKSPNEDDKFKGDLKLTWIDLWKSKNTKRFKINMNRSVKNVKTLKFHMKERSKHLAKQNSQFNYRYRYTY